jgi:hypothetical protein
MYGPVIIAQDSALQLYVGGVLICGVAILSLGVIGYRRYIDFDKNPTVKLRLPNDPEPTFETISEIIRDECKKKEG